MAPGRTAAEPKTSLTRALGRTTATLLTAAMILGTGLFAALGETADKAGSGLLLAMLLSGLVALATGLSGQAGRDLIGVAKGIRPPVAVVKV